MLATHPGGRAALIGEAAPEFVSVLEREEPQDPPPLWSSVMTVRPRGFQPYPLRAVLSRLTDREGRFAGVVELWLPNLSGELLGLVTLADPKHLERLASMTSSRRRPSAILFADLEASTPLARRLSTGTYFNLIRRVMRSVDELVVSRGGVVGRHVGDGLTAYYPAELCGGESAAAEAALITARALGGAVAAAAATVPGAGDIKINAGLHWGATVRLGAMLTAARFEVTALGEEVNEAARIEACATGGRVLASKSLIERLDDESFAALGIDVEGEYLPLADVPGAPEKARRDAPTVAVRPL
jgi:class 3 adenylate cyclase